MLLSEELAQGLVELWEQYTSKGHMFQPTMTDFVQWLREYQRPEREQEVNHDRTSPYLMLETPLGDYPVRGEHRLPVKSSEANVAQQSGGGVEISTVDSVKIRELYKEGYSAARIRQMLGLNVPIGRIYSIAQKKL